MRLAPESFLWYTSVGSALSPTKHCYRERRAYYERSPAHLGVPAHRATGGHL